MKKQGGILSAAHPVATQCCCPCCLSDGAAAVVEAEVASQWTEAYGSERPKSKEMRPKGRGAQKQTNKETKTQTNNKKQPNKQQTSKEERSQIESKQNTRLKKCTLSSAKWPSAWNSNNYLLSSLLRNSLQLHLWKSNDKGLQWTGQRNGCRTDDKPHVLQAVKQDRHLRSLCGQLKRSSLGLCPRGAALLQRPPASQMGLVLEHHQA